MKKLLYFASDYKIGLSSLLVDQLVSLHQCGANVIGVAGIKEQEKGLGAILSHNNIPNIRIEGLDEHSNFSTLVQKVKDIVTDNNIDVVHVQNNWQLAIVGAVKAITRTRRKIKIIYTLHGFRHNHPVKSKIAQLLIGSALYLLADNVICMTTYLKNKFNLLSYKITLLPLGVKDAFFDDEFIKPSVDRLKMIFPAQFREGKNQDKIIKAFYHYCQSHDDKKSTLTLPGEGPLKSEMINLVNNLQMKNQIFFPGQLSKDQIKENYINSNIAIVASNSETFGQSIVEPYVLGRCVVSTPVGITLEIIKEDNGFIFNNEIDLERILTALGANKDSLIEIGQTNYNMRDSFRWNEISNKYINQFLD